MARKMPRGATERTVLVTLQNGDWRAASQIDGLRPDQARAAMYRLYLAGVLERRWRTDGRSGWEYRRAA